jgi:hypothetical protein
MFAGNTPRRAPVNCAKSAQLTNRFRLMKYLTSLVAILLICQLAGSASAQSTKQDISKIPASDGSLHIVPSDLVVMSKDGKTATVGSHDDLISQVITISEITSQPGLIFDPLTTTKAETLIEKAKLVQLPRLLWQLEFAYKPMRMIEVDLPQVTGKMQRKRLWYLVYRVTNRGNYLAADPKPKDAGVSYEPKIVNELPEGMQPIRFFPHFVLRAPEQGKEYLDRDIPAAQKAIELRETRGGGTKLYSSTEISAIDLPISTPDEDRGVWGYVTWEDVDPRIDAFSVLVTGLTNAYKISDRPAAGTEIGATRKLSPRVLQLNFWRPSDAKGSEESAFRVGVQVDSDPANQAEILKRYGVDKRLEHLWIYR